MKYINSIRTNLFILSFLFVFINTNCIMPLYSPKVAKAGKMYLGAGVYEELYHADLKKPFLLYSSLFFRYGLPKGFDIGFDIKSTFIAPNLISINVRKQFDFKNTPFQSITYDIGYGFGFLNRMYFMNISTIRDKWALTVGYGRYIYQHMFVMDDRIYIYVNNDFLIKFSYQLTDKRRNTIVFIYYKAVQEFTTGGFGYSFPAINDYFQLNGWQYKQIGIGASVYFDIL